MTENERGSQTVKHEALGLYAFFLSLRLRYTQDTCRIDVDIEGGAGSDQVIPAPAAARSGIGVVVRGQDLGDVFG